MFSNVLKNKLLAGVSFGLGATVLVSLLIYSETLRSFHLSLSNHLFRESAPHAGITIIAIDEKSLDPQNGLGRYNDWPRTYFVQALTALREHDPKVVGIDIDFSSPSKGLSEQRVQEMVRALEGGKNPDFYPVLKETVKEVNHPDDLALQKIITDMGNVILLNARLGLTEEKGEYRAVSLDEKTPKSAIAYSGDGFGFALPDRDDVVRKTVLLLRDDDEKVLKSFDVKISEKFSETAVKNMNNKINPFTPTLINYQSLPGSFKTISFSDILAGKIKSEDFKDKIVLIGATAKILQDIVTVPNSSIPMAGIEVHANIIQQILQGKFLNEQTKIEQVLFSALMGVGGAVLFNYLIFSLGVVMVFVLGVLYWFGARFSFAQGMVLHMFYPYITLLLVLIGGAFYKYVTELRAKRYLKTAFAHYVNSSVVDEIVAHPEMLKLGGEHKEVSVLFSDIVSFTSLAEKMSPSEVVALLNEYLDAMTKVIFNYNGTLDKYEGDAIMAFFGAPLPVQQKADRACKSALEMRRALVVLHERWQMEHRPLIDFCVGIASGNVVAGNLGSQDRFDYTIIGDTVNLGSRLESANRQYGTKILVDEKTVHEVTSGVFVFRRLDQVRVKGKQNAVRIFELLGEVVTTRPEVIRLLHEFENGLAFYEKGQFAEAQKYFEAALEVYPNDVPSQIFKVRCGEFLKRPPSQEWDGAVELDKK
ncbi:MAG: Adenylate cyclase [Candidatus Peregrinibacteria bacterium GW2011_GWA2_47_7]|nr:MAG: Adenylate cyclase [Candidatus Peregrinibacteria bacterium GW2011_GWA2_47_7]